MKRIAPMSAARIAPRRTTDAEISLAIFASGFISGLIRFTKASIAVFTSSNVKTKKIVNNKIIHSDFVKSKTIAATIVRIAKSM